jgi:hypothetical protein
MNEPPSTPVASHPNLIPAHTWSAAPSVGDRDEFTVEESWLSTKPAVAGRLKLSSNVTAHETAIEMPCARRAGARSRFLRRDPDRVRSEDGRGH